MDITIRQPAGFGDIFFCQKIGVRLIELGHNVFWPVIPEYQYIEQYIDNGIIWKEPKNPTFELHINRATELLPWANHQEWYDHLMEAKYMYANQHFDIGGYEDWWKYFKLTYRHVNKEEYLYNLVMRPEYENGFCLCNRHFATQCFALRNIKIESNLPMLEIVKIPEVNLFDWCIMIEKASEIRIPDSSFPYIVEILDTTPNLYLYNRDTEQEIRTKKIWHKKWRYME